MPFERKYDRTVKCAEILEILRKPNQVPFLALAAERCGVNRSTVRNWLRQGENYPDKYPELARFSDEYKAIKSDWVMTAMQKIASAQDKGGDINAKHLEWLLHKLDNETFDPPKKVANVIKPEEEPEDEEKKAPTQDEVAQLANELAKVN